jgi:hypothetical protein
LNPNRTPIQGKYQTIGSRDDLKTYPLEVVFTPNENKPDREKDCFVMKTIVCFVLIGSRFLTSPHFEMSNKKYDAIFKHIVHAIFLFQTA